MTYPAATPIALGVSEFQKLRDLIQHRFGLYFTDDTAYLLERRLLPRVEALHMRSFLDYHDYLVNPALPDLERDRELDEIFERVATRETYFFRERYQLDALREELLPRLHRDKPRGERLRIWSAGCSTGEEVYSIAIQILETGLFDGWDVRVQGADLSHQALATARAATYGPSSFRQTDERWQRRYFTDLGGRWQLRPEVRRLCTFTRANLVRTGDSSPDWAAIDGDLDAIFCRNVLIYFPRPRRLGLIEDFAAKLAPDGYLFLGHSESLHDQKTPFVSAKLDGALVYRRAAAKAPAP